MKCDLEKKPAQEHSGTMVAIEFEIAFIDLIFFAFDFIKVGK